MIGAALVGTNGAIGDALRLGAVLAASFLALHLVQRLADRRAARRLEAAAARLGLAPRPLPPEIELRAELPFLAALDGATPVALRSATDPGREAHLVALRAPAGPALGYTLLARRVAAPSARDDRAVASALARAGAWLAVEGEWRVLGAPVLARGAVVDRLAAIEALIEERQSAA